MIRRTAQKFFHILLALLLGLGVVFPKEEKSTKSSLRKTAANDQYATILINNLFNYYSNTGDGSYNKFNGTSALEYPKGSNLTVSFEDGFAWGCYQNDSLKTGGSAYRHALQAGPIITPGTPAIKPLAADPTDSRYRLYRVRPDINPTTAFTDVQKILLEEEVPLILRYENVTASSLYDQYIKDWNEWPAADGAPFVDKNNNGTYEPSIDIPGIKDAGQTLWHISNDLDSSRTEDLYGSPPIGLEYQRTIWAYQRKGALDNTILVKNILINKSGVRLDSMYVAAWSDPDLGDAGDDLCGCDMNRDLGFIYNGDGFDNFYGDRVPSLGYQMLQGPIVAGAPAETANFCGRKIAGHRNQRMTAFNFFLGASAMYTDPSQGSYNGTIMLYHLLKGTLGNTGEPYRDPFTGNSTTYPYSGDPVSKLGWIDGVSIPMGDRRMMEVSGPFTMMPGDTQEVIIATVVARANDRLSSITLLRSYVDEIRTIYQGGFEVPHPISPVVSAPPLNEEIVLSWSDSARTAEIESFDQAGYKFEGYNVYALPGPEFKNAVRLKTYDRNDGIGFIRDIIFDDSRNDIIEATVQWGTDEGVRRYYETTGDSLTKSFIRNYHTYYFAVSAYYVSLAQNARPMAIESEPAIVTVIPLPPNSGVRLGSRYGDTISVRHISGKSETSVITQVIDPTKVTGHAYKVFFDTTADQITWSLQDTTASPSLTILSQQTNLSGSGDSKIVDGIQVRVTGSPSQGMKDWAVHNGTRRWTWIGADGLHLEGFNGAIGWNEPSFLFHVNTRRTVTADNLKHVRLNLANAFSDTGKNGISNYAGWNQNLVSDTNFSYGYRYVIGGTTPARPEFAPYLIGHTQGNWGYVDYKRAAVPFSAWDLETVPPTRLAVGFTENNVAGGLIDGRYWPPVGGAQTNTGSSGPQEWFFIFNKPYTDAAPEASLQNNILNTAMPVMWMGTVERRNSSDFPGGDEFEIIPYYAPGVHDIYVFQTPSTTNTIEKSITDIERINIFPNPYFAGNIDEPNKYTRFVTITHLPRKANIRIFTVGGYLVRTILKEDDLSYVRWDLMNRADTWVASGMYIIHVDMPDLGKVKFLKLAVIQQVFVPDHY